MLVGLAQTGAGLFFGNTANNSVILKHYSGASLFIDVSGIWQTLQPIRAQKYGGSAGSAIPTIEPYGSSLYFNATPDDKQMIFDPGGLVIGSGGVPIHTSARLQADSTTKGFLTPRMSKAQRDAISTPAQGLVVFVTDNGGYLSWYNSGWFKINSSVD